MTELIDVEAKIWEDMFTESALALKERGLYSSNLLYRSFFPDRLEEMLQTGTDRDNSSSMWGRTGNAQKLLFLDSEELLQTGRWRVYGHSWKGRGRNDLWTVAVYEPDTVRHVKSDEYSLPEGTKTVAVLRINTARVPLYK